MKIEEARSVLRDHAATLSEKIAAAAVLWALVEECKKDLDLFKEIVRPIAVKDGRTTVYLEGDGLSQCKVVISHPTLVLNPGLREVTERDALGEHFDDIYKVNLSLVQSSAEDLARYPRWVQAHMATVTSVVVHPPRVSIRHLSGVEEIKTDSQ